jgi:hypothetical protein
VLACCSREKLKCCEREALVGYGLYSSLLAVINKYTITYFPFPGLLTALWYVTSMLGVWVVGKAGLI